MARAAKPAGKPPTPPLPNDPDEATAVALALITDPTSQVVPSEVFRELSRRNQVLANAPTDEIQATLTRQIVLLEAMATRLIQKAALAPNPSATAEFTRAALATERVLVQALGAVHQLNQNRNQGPALTMEGEGNADVS